MSESTVTLDVNGKTHTIEVDPATPLVYVLRNHLGLTAAKIGCGLEQCGSCAVLVDGESTLTCSAPAAQFEGRRIVTLEGLSAPGESSDVQRAFEQAGAAQCGYCTSGLVIATTALLTRDAAPEEDAIRSALEPHLCRCGSHPRVLRAVRSLAARG